MIESSNRPSITDRVLTLCQDHDKQATYHAQRLYVGSQEYDYLRQEAGRIPGCRATLIPSVNLYQQGSAQFLGLNVYVLRDLTSHLAIA